MKYNMITRVIIAVTLLFIITTSCTKNPSNIELIPIESEAVMVFNISSLIEKGELLSPKNIETVKQAIKNNKKVNKTQLDFFESVLENPLSTGIDFEKDCFSFQVKNNEKVDFLVVTFGLVNEESLTSFITRLFKESDKELLIEEYKGYKFAFTTNKSAVAWNDENFLIIASNGYGDKKEDIKNQTKNLYNLTNDKKLIRNESFQSFYKKKKDISSWASSSVLKDTREIKALEDEYDIDASDNFISFYLDFKEGAIDLDANFDGNKEIKEIISNNQILNDDFNSELLGYISDDNFGLVTLSINPDELYEVIKSNRAVAMGSMSKVTPQEFLQSLGGSFAFSVSSFKSETNDSFSRNKVKPLAAFTFDLKDEAVLEELISILPANLFQEEDGYYILVDDTFLREPIYLSYNKEACLITNDHDLILNFKNNKTLPNFINNISVSNEIGNNSLYVNLPLDLDKIPDEARKQMDREFSRSDAALLVAINKLINSIDFKLSNKTTASLSVKLIENEGNSLKTIIETLEKEFKEKANQSNY